MKMEIDSGGKIKMSKRIQIMKLFQSSAFQRKVILSR